MTAAQPPPPGAMSRESRISWTTTETVMSILRRIIRANIIAEGLEHLSDRPTLFVVNHFTRFETFILPYILYKHMGRAVRSLAYHELFKGRLGGYLQSLGAVSTQEPNKELLILRDLMTGANQWVIFPEGAMMKSKLVMEGGRYWLDHPARVGPPHTGAAVLALKAEFARRAYRRARDTGRADVLEHYRQHLGLDPDAVMPEEPVGILPVNITYYPLRPGANLLSKAAGFFFREMPPDVLEELVVEGQLLLSESDITVYFGPRIPIDRYVRPLPELGLGIPLLPGLETGADVIASFQRFRVMRRFMKAIYSQTTINIDHLFCGALQRISRDRIAIDDLHRALYLSALAVREQTNRRTHASLRNKLVTILTDDVHEPLNNIVRLAESEGICRREGEFLSIDQKALSDRHQFHDVRLKNTVRVIANEILPLPRVCAMLQQTVNLPSDVLRERAVEALCRRDQQEFDENYARYFMDGVSKPREVGRPFFLRGTSPYGIVLSHGYLSAPMEIRLLAEHLHGLGYSVYGVRLEGHGTSPHHIRDIAWQNWLHSFYRGYAVIKNSCRHIVVGGFSTGGLVALITAARMGGNVAGVFAINASLRLKDIRTRVVAPIMMWSELLQKFGKAPGVQFVEHHSENPHINYSLNYINGVRELHRLIGVCENGLKNVRCPALLVQARHDPAVNPRSAELILAGLGTPRKRLEWMDFDRHVIIQKTGREKVFEVIADFIGRLATDTGEYPPLPPV